MKQTKQITDKRENMKISNGKIFLTFGIIHPLLGISPFAFGKQFSGFSNKLFFKISEGLFEFPLLNGIMNYENFAAFWFFYFGLILIPIGFLVNHIENEYGKIPETFVWSYLVVVLIGAFMIPFSGMTFLMLPHAIYMVYQKKDWSSMMLANKPHPPAPPRCNADPSGR